MSKPSTKLWLCFLSNVLAVFDRFNTSFQSSSVSTAHKSYGEIICLLKTVLGFLIKQQVIIQHSDDLTKLRFHDISTHRPDDEIYYIGDSTTYCPICLPK